MVGQLFINDKDAWLTWRVKLDDGFDELRLPANPKEYVENDSRVQPGKQVFVSNTQPQSKAVRLIFAIVCDSSDEYNEMFDLFINELKGVVVFKVPALKKIFFLRVTDYISLSSGLGLREGRLSVQFSEDNPSSRKSSDISAYVLSVNNKALVSRSNKVLTKEIE